MKEKTDRSVLVAVCAEPLPAHGTHVHTWQGCVEASTKECAAKAHSVLLPAVAHAANDPAPAAREAALEVLAAFARRAGSMRPVDKARSYSSACRLR